VEGHVAKLTIVAIALVTTAAAAQAQTIGGFYQDHGPYCCGLGSAESFQRYRSYQQPAHEPPQSYAAPSYPQYLPQTNTGLNDPILNRRY
jgi:hypothetical protein